MVKEITVLSGKGGTGKTSLTASFAVLAEKTVFTDCDVDAPDLHLLLNPEVIDEKACVQCRKCEEYCRFGAIEKLIIDPILCEGCGVCTFICPVAAIELEKRISGYAYLSKTKYGLMSHAKKVAEQEECQLIINDGPPGIGCPVIASVGGVDVGLIVVEPTLSGIHDMKRALSLLNHFNIPAVVCVNKFNLNNENTESISKFCESNGVEIVGKIPFDQIVTEAMVAGRPIVEYLPECKVSQAIKATWERTLQYI